MKKITKLTAILTMLFCFLAPKALLAQDSVVVAQKAPVKELVEKAAQATNSDVIQQVFEFFKIADKTPLAVAFLLVQLSIYFLNAPMSGEIFKKLTGEMKLTVLAVLTAIFGVLASMYLGKESISNALTDSFNLYLIKIGLHQVYEKFYAKKQV